MKLTISLARTHARMARRHKALWFTMIPLLAFATSVGVISPGAPGTGGAADLAFTGQLIAVVTGIAYTAACTDLFSGPARSGMDEFEASTPVAPLVLRSARVLGTLSVVIPPSLAVLLVLGTAQAIDGNPWSLPTAIGVAATIVGPAALIALALSGLVGAVLPRATSRVVAVLAWLLPAFLTPQLIPLATMNGALFSIAGDAVAAGFFGTDPIYEPTAALTADGTPLNAALALVWQLVLAAALLTAGSVLAERTRKR